MDPHRVVDPHRVGALPKVEDPHRVGALPKVEDPHKVGDRYKAQENLEIKRKTSVIFVRIRLRCAQSKKPRKPEMVSNLASEQRKTKSKSKGQ